MSDCPFCSKAVHDLQCVLKTQNELVLHNIRPATRGHLLVIPQRHVSAIRQLPQDEFLSLAGLVQRVANDLMDVLRPAPIGLNYCSNEGEYAGQSVEHAHIHLIPRYEDDGLTQYHLSHRPDAIKRNWTPEELGPSVAYFRDLLHGI